jgi:nucleoside-diphosphate-sugar epimerase
MIGESMPDESLATSTGSSTTLSAGVLSDGLLSAGTVAVVGGSGFVGGAVVRRLGELGLDAEPLAAPRVRYRPPLTLTRRGLPVARDAYPDVVGALAARLAGADVVVNAAGISYGNAPAGPALYGANVLMPVLVARAAALTGVKRYVHLSSAAAQGHLDLDESPRTAPFSPYSYSKALGERALLAEDGIEIVVFRSTWVHDAGRANTLSLIRLARSGAACVAGDGTRPTPQVLVGDIAGSVSYLVRTSQSPPRVVTQPSNGMTTGGILRLLGCREPRHLPEVVARLMVPAVRAGGRMGVKANSVARRVEMLLFGKPHAAPGWLAEHGVVPVLNPEDWTRLAATRRRR